MSVCALGRVYVYLTEYTGSVVNPVLVKVDFAVGSICVVTAFIIISSRNARPASEDD